MNLKKAITVLTFFLTLSNYSQDLGYVQSVFPSSPEASALSEYAKIPVELYTGLANVNLKLIELPGKDMTIPITISYHGAGNKVEEISSSIGLGWTLNAGGIITRVVRGKNDDDPNGYVGSNQHGSIINNTSFLNLTNSQVLQFGASPLESVTWDSEPDIFYFNFLGHTGRFVLTYDGKVIQTPEHDFKILPAFGPQSSNSYWTIIDKTGYQYKFGVTSDETETTDASTVFGGEESDIMEYVSSWYLSSIVSPTGETASFEYKKGTDLEIQYEIENYADTNCYTGYGTTTSKTKVIGPLVIEKITSRFGHIDFTSTSDRQDLLSQNRVTSLKLYDQNSSFIKGILFNQNYFYSKENCFDEECLRLKLESVDEQSSSYQTIRKYEFTYNSTKLPRRDSYEFDHWGYYNGNNESNLISRSDPYNINSIRAPNETYTKAQILEKITYPTQGYTQFYYELNDYLSGSSNIPTGGLRISKIENNDSSGSPIITEYKYLVDNTSLSSGTQYSIPKYINSETVLLTIPRADGSTYSISCTGNRLYSHSLNELFDLNGSNVGYGEVTILYGDGSEEINKFSDFNSNPDIKTSTDYFTCRVGPGGIDISGYLDPTGSPYAPSSKTNSYQRGLLIQKITKNSTGGIVRELINNYGELPKNINLISKGYRFRRLFVYDQYAYDPITQQSYYQFSIIDFDTGAYEEFNGNYRLLETIEKNYDNSNPIIKTVSYDYSLIKPSIVKETSTFNSADEELKSTYSYPFDLTGTINTVLTDNNQIGNPIETKNYLASSLLNTQTNEFEYNTTGYINDGNSPLFKTTDYSKGNSSSIYNNVTIERYDTFGNVLQYTEKNGVTTSILWGYGDRYPIAKVINASYDDILGSSLNMSIINSDNPSETSLRSEINKIRTHLGNAQVNGYTYDELIGVSSTVDTKNYTLYYEYDDFNRLKMIKDIYGMIIQETDYHYKE